ncbi:MAG: MopE-related protein [Candidatus Pacearchaeota archaeon]|jgi:hypothetical protein
MKKRCASYCILLFLLIVFSINIISAQKFIIDNTNIYSNSKTAGSYYQDLNKNDVNITPKTSIKATSKLSLSSINTITVVWPEQGYYYITDNLFLEIDTSNPSSCTYTFNGKTENMIDNQTNHYKLITGLIDNMASNTNYIIDFNCHDGFTTTSASTYFKINTSELDRYFIRSNLGNWNYINSQWEGYVNKDGLIEYYRSVYNPSDKKPITNQIDVLIFDSENSLAAGVKKYFLDEYGSKISIQSIGDKNFYVYTVSDEKFIGWKSGNYFVANWVYPYQNLTPVDFEISEDILNPYLSKYPNDLKYGTCGDGKVNVFNLDGIKEECDKNSEVISCGSNTGECRAGQKSRKCASNCTWQDYGACNDTKPQNELCDSKDNNCDGKTDETFTFLGQTCNAGVGICKQQGKYICSSSGSGVACNVLANTPQKETCNDGIDNDCDGFIDFNDANDCTPLNVNSPINKVYSGKNILFDIFSNYLFNDITYSYLDNRGKEIKVKLCSKCNTYNKTKSLKDGVYNISIAIGNKSQAFSNKQLSFLVDSIAPKISKTLPKKGFTNGNFTVQFKEDNPKELELIFEDQKKNLDLINECITEKGVQLCNTKVNLAGLEGKEIWYYFNLTDITGKSATSKPVKLIVDTTIPTAKINWTIKKGKVNFVFNITEAHFDEISYVDSSDSKPKEIILCSRLKDNMCKSTKTFKTGIHNLVVYVKDEAGNTLKSQVNINI